MTVYTYYSSYNMCLCYKVMAIASSYFGINFIKLFIEKNTFFFVFFQTYSVLC